MTKLSGVTRQMVYADSSKKAFKNCRHVLKLIIG